jgi:uncharacterized membrane protein
VAGWGDEKIEVIVGNLLRAGVLLSASVVVIGAAVFLTRNGLSPTDFHVFRGEPVDFRSIWGILRAAFTMRGRGIIQLGLLLLIATPVARVAFSIFGFAKEKDYMYVGFTMTVFVILLYSMFGNH